MCGTSKHENVQTLNRRIPFKEKYLISSSSSELQLIGHLSGRAERCPAISAEVERNFDIPPISCFQW
jgi:hypothetical protein